MSRSTIRTGSWVEVPRWRCIVSTTRGGCGRAAMKATPTARTTKRMSRSGSVSGLAAPSSTVTATTGPNSPAVPAATRNLPNGDLEHVPVVEHREQGAHRRRRQRQSPTSRLETTKPEMSRSTADAEPEHQTDTSHPAIPRLRG